MELTVSCLTQADRKILDYIRSNPEGFLFSSIGQLARQLGVSRTCLYKAFRSCSGKSVQQYLQDLRLEAACRFLAETSRTVTDIAFSCGFADAPSFCRIFRRVYGQTPLEFRETKKAASP